MAARHLPRPSATGDNGGRTRNDEVTTMTRNSDTTPDADASVLFVCLGNICRSPTAEGVFRAAVAQQEWGSRIRVDSAGTGDWHVGSPPDRRAIQAARRRGYDLTPLRARQVGVDDFERFGWIVAMDRANLRALEALRPPQYAGHLGLFLDFAPDAGLDEVPDPYYGGLEGFDRVLDLVEVASAGLLERLRQRMSGQ
jgi:protein-tyrosine phosphatase